MAEKKTAGLTASLSAVGSAPRPGVLSLNIRERAALYAAYMPFLRGGGIFIPTPRQYQLERLAFKEAVAAKPLAYIPGCFAEKKGWK